VSLSVYVWALRVVVGDAEKVTDDLREVGLAPKSVSRCEGGGWGGGWDALDGGWVGCEICTAHGEVFGLGHL
jgi:hypothetical protein